MQKCVTQVFAPFGIPAPTMDLKGCNIDQFYDWIEGSLEVLKSCGRIWGEINAKAAARALAASFCALVPTEEPSKTIGRSDVRAMKELGYRWSSTNLLEHSHLPSLEKAIGNNFMQNLLNPNGLELLGSEARRVADSVRTHLAYFYFSSVVPSFDV